MIFITKYKHYCTHITLYSDLCLSVQLSDIYLLTTITIDYKCQWFIMIYIQFVTQVNHPLVYSLLKDNLWTRMNLQ